MDLKQRHSFEFMDLAGVPQSIRLTMREVLECAMSAPFRDYYDWVAAEAGRIALARGCDTIVELGAGTAPLTRRLAVTPALNGMKLLVCDLNPDVPTYNALERDFPGQVSAIYESVEFATTPAFGDRAVLVLSATFHHVPDEARVATLKSLLASSPNVLVFEPLRRTLQSVLYAAMTVIPGFIAPLVFLKFHGIRREGHLRRLFWCWLVPAVPFLLAWDGIISCLRMWTTSEWLEALASLGGEGSIEPSLVREIQHSQVVDCFPAAQCSSKARRNAA